MGSGFHSDCRASKWRGSMFPRRSRKSRGVSIVTCNDSVPSQPKGLRKCEPASHIICLYLNSYFPLHVDLIVPDSGLVWFSFHTANMAATQGSHLSRSPSRRNTLLTTAPKKDEVWLILTGWNADYLGQSNSSRENEAKIGPAWVRFLLQNQKELASIRAAAPT